MGKVSGCDADHLYPNRLTVVLIARKILIKISLLSSRTEYDKASAWCVSLLNMPDYMNIRCEK